MTGRWRVAVAALLGAVAFLAFLLALAGYDAAAALAAMARGAFGSWYAFTSATLVRAVPLTVIGLGICIAFRAGVFNIGAEGQFYAGAIAATAIGLHVATLPPSLAIAAVWLAASVAGLAWASLPAWLKHRFGVLEVISTLLLNFVAEALVSWAVQGPLQESKGIYPQSDPIAAGARLPLLPGTRLHLGFAAAVLLACGLAYLMRRTWWGFALTACGAGPRVAEVVGRIRVSRTTAVALLISGALAGLAGGIEVSGVSYALFQNLSPGYGFSGIAVALLGRLDPLAVLVAGILFGALEAGAGAMQREAGVPAVLVYVVEAVVIVSVLLGDAAARRRRQLQVPEPVAAPVP
ncbi:MAG TPA: ABC transporter permease [Gemmatimonadales bacterium]|nr:ABC transporter permease [Gemmatimonadales bacterium]